MESPELNRLLGGTFGDDACDPDDDDDTWSAVAEATIGTDPQDPCTDTASHNAWPPDMNNDGSVTFGDIGHLRAHRAAAAAAPDVAPESPDSSITFCDIGRMTGLLGLSRT